MDEPTRWQRQAEPWGDWAPRSATAGRFNRPVTDCAGVAHGRPDLAIRTEDERVALDRCARIGPGAASSDAGP